MIVYDLECGGGHRFEGWFGSKDDFAAQRKKGLVGCPTCGAQEVRRVPSVTRFNSGAGEPQPSPPAQAAEFAGKDPAAIAQILYARLVDDLLQKSEDVGRAFPDEARKIHHEEAPARSIRGQATDEEHAQLLDEGIAVLRFAVPPRDRMN